MDIWGIISVISIIAIIIIVIMLLLSMACWINNSSDIKKKTRNTITIDQLSQKGNSGDLLLFSCNNTGFAPGWVRKIGFATEWTHSAILYIEPETRIPYIWESTTLQDGVTDHFSNQKNKKGAQLVKLEERLKKYDGYCVVKSLYPSFENVLGKEEVNKRFELVFKKYSGRVFNSSWSWIGLLVIIEIMNINPSNLLLKNMRRWLCAPDSVICTELVSGTYKMLGLWDHIDYTIPAKNPTDLRKRKCPETFLPHHFAYDYNLGGREIKEEYEIIV